MQKTIENIPEQMPLLPLKDIVIFPQMILPVFVAEEICIKTVETALASDKLIFLSAFRAEQKDGEDDSSLKCSTPTPFDVYDVGTVALIMRTRKLPDGRLKVLIQGVERATIQALEQRDPVPVVKLSVNTESKPASSSEADALMRTVRELIEKMIAFGKPISPDIMMLLEDIHEAGRFADVIASHLGLKVADAQKVLGTFTGIDRLKRVHAHLIREVEVFNMQVRIQSQAREEFSKSQREHFLREQMKAIKAELGEMDGKDDLEDLREKVMNSGLSAEARAECMKQLRRLERMHQDSSESVITRSYVEWMVDLPWNKSSETPVDLLECKKIMDEDHYGVDKIKERILEFIAVRKLNPNLKGPIVCFFGPPGVGKTSLGRSIARALGRKFVRISLGGVRDEAEIRGHRRTYVGAHPGRIIQAIKTAGVNNPVIMLDEIDKLGNDFRGDPSSALLEVLDPEQNNTFSDHYISVPFDLSQVVFIANANNLDTIPPPLRDRLEIIEVMGYSEDEKMEIAKNYIIPKQIKNCGLETDSVQFQESAVELVINNYTRESGLRNLEKQVGSVCRKLARTVAEDDARGEKRKVVKVTSKMVKELLGEEKYLREDHDVTIPRIGVATGLAYTSVGGEILELEVNLLPGKGRLVLTGHLGNVMKESAQAALSYIRCYASSFGIESNKFQEFDIHVHAPAGGVPKDGPSAGVAFTSALISALTGEPLRQDVAMTGEITTHGRILPVGGLREKILAALRVGIQTVCIPERNRGAIQELPANIRKRIHIKLVSNVEDVLSECFSEAWFSERTAKRDSTQRAGKGASSRSKRVGSAPIAAA